VTIIEDIIASFQQPERLKKIVRATFSGPRDATGSKVQLKPVALKDGMYVQRVDLGKQSSKTRHIALEHIQGELEELFQTYTHCFLRLEEEEWYAEARRDGHWKSQNWKGKKKRLKVPYTADLAHNRKKKHLLEEGVIVPSLVALDILTKEGKVKAQAAAKFKQINRFIEIVSSVLPRFQDSITVVDLCCGKAYLTFALEYFLRTHYPHPYRLVGVDQKTEVIATCNHIASTLCDNRISFVQGSIADFEPDGPVDIVIALHACDTATDIAIEKALLWGAKAIFVAPCCQHALNAELKKEMCPVLFKHGLFKERFASLLTDVMRVQQLEAAGYSVDVIEFVDPVHTPKNILLRAVSVSAREIH